MPVLKKPQDRRLTTRKKKALMKRATTKTRKMQREAKKAARLKMKIPVHVLRTDEENEHHAEIKRKTMLRKKEHEERLKGLAGVPEHVEKLNRLIEDSDIIVEVVDARDPMCSRSPETEEAVHRHGKRCVLVLSYVEFVPREVVEGWKQILRESGLCCIEVDEFEPAWTRGGARVGIFGGPRAGKYFVSKKLRELHGLEMEMSLVSIPAEEASLSGLLRGANDPYKVNCIPHIDALLGMIDHDDLCIHHKIPGFGDVHELLGHLRRRAEKSKSPEEIQNADLVKAFLEPFHRLRILFWRSVEDRDLLCFRFPEAPL
jgi:hypothetical protein